MKTDKYCTKLEIKRDAPHFRHFNLESANVDSGWVATIRYKGFLAGFEADGILTTTNISSAIIFRNSSDASRAGRGFHGGTYNLSDGVKIVQEWVLNCG